MLQSIPMMIFRDLSKIFVFCSLEYFKDDPNLFIKFAFRILFYINGKVSVCQVLSLLVLAQN